MKEKLTALLPICLATLFLLTGCGEKPTEPDDSSNNPIAAKGSFALIQEHIFDKSCAVSGCHVGFDAAGGLSLESGKSYQNLINVTPQNSAAAQDGLLRVAPGDRDGSFLYRKLSGVLTDDQGARMPLGSSQLDDGKIEFIRTWIGAGAPDTGVVADPALLGEEALPFTAPDPPTSGFQLHLPKYQIPPQSDREIFYFMRSPNQQGVFVNGFDVKMRDNSHHFILYSYSQSASRFPQEKVFRDLGAEMDDYWSDRIFFIGSQEADFSYQFPPGVALYLPANAGLDLNSHYVNPTNGPIDGEAYVNLHTTPQATTIAQSLFWGPQDFLLPPHQETTVYDTLVSPYKANIYMLSSHTHRHGKSFRIYLKKSGQQEEMIYENYDWHLPTMKLYSEPLTINMGDRLRLETVYYNDSGYPIGYGPTSEDEMCFVIGYFALAD